MNDKINVYEKDFEDVPVQDLPPEGYYWIFFCFNMFTSKRLEFLNLDTMVPLCY